MSSPPSPSNKASFGFGCQYLDPVFDGLGKLVNGVTGFPGEQYAMGEECLTANMNRDEAAFDVALHLHDYFAGMFLSPQRTNPVYPGFPFVDSASAASAAASAASASAASASAASAATDADVVQPDYQSCVVYCYASATGGIIYTTTHGNVIESKHVLQTMAAHGATFSFNRMDSPPPQAPKKSHKAKLKCASDNDKLTPTNARSLRVKIPATPYSPMTTGGGRAVAGGVSKAKTPSPVTPATAPKETAANK